jgi:NAD(P)-dependent dehydrogenase (short-subunit alcohol dehydrogenase family)
MRLQGKTAVITGAAGDIGQCTARRFHAEGARLVLLDRDNEGLEAFSRSFDTLPMSVAADVTNEGEIRQAAEAVRTEIGQIDILFINAGIEQSHVSIIDMEKETFERVVAVNLTGAFVTAKHFLPIVADHGSVVFTSSTAGLMAFPSYSAYSASKAGVIGLMRSAALDVAQRRIRCNTIHPGPVQSKMLERSAQEATGGHGVEAWYDAMSGMARMGRLVEPDDVASLALFLSSDESAMISSQTIAVDGGVV